MGGFFGSTGNYIAECPPAKPYTAPAPKCEATSVTETLMAKCHGRTSCSVDTDRAYFDLPSSCLPPKEVTMMFKATFACVPYKILKVQSTSPPEPDEADFPQHAPDGAGRVDPVPHTDQRIFRVDAFPEGHSHDMGDKSVSFVPIFRTKPEARWPLSGHHDANCTHIVRPAIAFRGVVSFISAYAFFQKNTEKMVLFLLASISSSLLVTFILLSTRLYLERKAAEAKQATEVTGSEKSPLRRQFSEINAEELLGDLEEDGSTGVSQSGVSLLQAHYGTNSYGQQLSYGHVGHSLDHDHGHGLHDQGHSHHHHHVHHHRQPHHVHPMSPTEPEAVFYTPSDLTTGQLIQIGTIGRPSTLRRASNMSDYQVGHLGSPIVLPPSMDIMGGNDKIQYGQMPCTIITSETSYF
ncbi:hypothetical protein HDE_01771 [Halotydeus destructor]|nr:hypothetical protein HDE_01771 [Halotydeus destructor]